MTKKDEGGVIILIDKLRGETMGELTRRVRREEKLEVHEKITFAGRLDPLASGLVVYLGGESRFKREEFLLLPKRYEFEIVFGIKTDTGDPLGKIISISEAKVDEGKLRSSLNSFVGEQTQKYPFFSSKTVEGKPLFEYAKQGKKVSLPEHTINISSLELVSLTTISKEKLIKEVLRDIKLVRGDFRQTLIIDRWQKLAYKLPGELCVATCVVECSSGTYVRALAERVAAKLKTVALARRIHRTHIGEFTNPKSVV